MSQFTFEEEEQIANLKAWWAKYGTALLLLMIVVFGGFAANNGWKWWKSRQATSAVVVYEKLEQAVEKSDMSLVAQIQKTLTEAHGSSPYAERGALLVAKALFEKGKMDEAKVQLKWAVEHSSEEEYAATATLMLTAVLIQEDKLDEAKTLLDKKEYTGFSGLFLDRKGDIALAQKHVDQAKQYYEAALKALQEESPWKQVVERKIAALPKSGEQKS